MPSVLKSLSHHSLVFGAGAGAVMVKNFAVRRHKAAQGLRIFIVYGADFVGAKIALLFNLRLVVFIVVVVGSHKK